MSENSRALGVRFALGCSACATWWNGPGGKTMSQDLATPTESGLAWFRSFPEEEVVFDSGKFQGTRLRGRFIPTKVE